MATFPGAVADDSNLYNVSNFTATTLDGAIDAITTTIVLTSAAAFPTSGLIVLDGANASREIISYTSKTGNSLNGVVRGADGSVAASHLDLVVAELNIVADHHNSLKEEVKSIEQNISDRLGLGSTDVVVNNGSILTTGDVVVGTVVSPVEGIHLVGPSKSIFIEATEGGATGAALSAGGGLDAYTADSSISYSAGRLSIQDNDASNPQPQILLDNQVSGKTYSISTFPTGEFAIQDGYALADSKRLVIDANGLVGIGSEPISGFKLAVEGGEVLTSTGFDLGVSGEAVGLTVSGGLSRIKAYSGGALAAGDLLIQESSGNVGIGAAPAAEKLEVSGAIVVGDAAGTADGTVKYTGSDFEGRKAGAWVSLTSGGGGGGNIGDAVTGGTTGSILFVGSGPILSQDNANLFWNNTTNRLAVGSTSPIAGIHSVDGTSAVFGAGGDNTGTVFPSVGSVAFFGVGDNSTYASIIQAKNGGNRGTKGNANGSPLLRLDFSDVIGLIFTKNGDLGIGTASPNNPLTVTGNANITGKFGIGVTSPSFDIDVSSSDPRFHQALVGTNGTVGSYMTGAPGTIYMQGNGTAFSYVGMDGRSFAGQFVLDSGWGTEICINQGTASGIITFGTNSVEKMRILTNGNIGINTTAQFGSGAKVIGIANATTLPTTTPTGGGVLYVEAGALKYKGSSGTVTLLANA